MRVEICVSMPTSESLPRVANIVGARVTDTGGWLVGTTNNGNTYDAWFTLPSPKDADEALGKLLNEGYEAKISKLELTQ